MLSEWHAALADYLRLLPVELRPRVVAHHTESLATFLRWLETAPVALTDFRLKHLLLFLSDRHQRQVVAGKGALSEHTKANYKKVIRRFFRFCYEDGRVPQNPFATLKVPAPPQADVFVPDVGELGRLFAGMRDHWKGAVRVGHVFMRPREKQFYYRHNLALFSLLIDTGCRISEALGVQVDDLALEEAAPTVFLRQQKGGGQRTLPLSPQCVAALQSYLTIRPKGTPQNPVVPALFLTVAGHAYSYAMANLRMCQYRKLCGLPRLTLHSLRHYTLTTLAEVDLWAAQGIAGHKSPRTTQIYAHRRGRHLQSKHAEANPLGQVLGTLPPSVPRVSRRKRV